LDETWIYEHGNQLRQWVNESDPLGVPQRLEGEGRRFTILHAGTSAGFLPNCDLLLSSEVEYRDYHKNMNAILFTKWVKDQLFPVLSCLDKPCVVVMENAPYHSEQFSKTPVSSTRKAEMINWLDSNNIPYPFSATKFFLYIIILERKQVLEKMYVIDNLIDTNRHVVLRLPPLVVSCTVLSLVNPLCLDFVEVVSLHHLMNYHPNCPTHLRNAFSALCGQKLVLLFQYYYH
jgi:hypothetical protein